MLLFSYLNVTVKYYLWNRKVRLTSLRHGPLVITLPFPISKLRLSLTVLLLFLSDSNILLTCVPTYCILKLKYLTELFDMFCTNFYLRVIVCGVDINNELRVFDVVQKVFNCIKKNETTTRIWLYIAALLSAVLVHWTFGNNNTVRVNPILVLFFSQT